MSIWVVSSVLMIIANITCYGLSFFVDLFLVMIEHEVCIIELFSMYSKFIWYTEKKIRSYILTVFMYRSLRPKIHCKQHDENVLQTPTTCCSPYVEQPRINGSFTVLSWSTPYSFDRGCITVLLSCLTAKLWLNNEEGLGSHTDRSILQLVDINVCNTGR